MVLHPPERRERGGQKKANDRHTRAITSNLNSEDIVIKKVQMIKLWWDIGSLYAHMYVWITTHSNVTVLSTHTTEIVTTFENPNNIKTSTNPLYYDNNHFSLPSRVIMHLVTWICT